MANDRSFTILGVLKMVNSMQMLDEMGIKTVERPDLWTKTLDRISRQMTARQEADHHYPRS